MDKQFWPADCRRDGGLSGDHHPNNFAKRMFDVTFVLATGIVWMPLLAGIAALVWLRMGRPIFFRQPRPGLSARIFQIRKFRTMTDKYDAAGRPLGDGVRLTPFGRWLRSTSLDELPELFSVLKGDMSLVGPRPLLVEYLPRYNPRQRRRHEVKPGITGFAQVNGRNSLSWEDKLEFDVRYVESHSLLGDMGILWRTAVSVIRREGINAKNNPTMPEFNPTDHAE